MQEPVILLLLHEGDTISPSEFYFDFWHDSYLWYILQTLVSSLELSAEDSKRNLPRTTRGEDELWCVLRYPLTLRISTLRTMIERWQG